MEDKSPVLYVVEGAVALITLNRPQKRNALNDALIAGLKSVLHDADERETVRVVVITGAGDDFSSGATSRRSGNLQSSITENLEDAQIAMELFG